MVKGAKHPIPDKAEVAIDFPDKFYMGSFSRESKFEAQAENDGLMIRLNRAGDEKRTAEVHFHHYLLADILTEWANSLADDPIQDDHHRETLLDALKAVEKAVGRKRRARTKKNRGDGVLG